MDDLHCDLSSIVLDHGSRLLMDIAELYNLSQLINEPTRTTDSSSTLIDHTFANTPDKVVCSGKLHSIVLSINMPRFVQSVSRLLNRLGLRLT